MRQAETADLHRAGRPAPKAGIAVTILALSLVGWGAEAADADARRALARANCHKAEIRPVLHRGNVSVFEARCGALGRTLTVTCFRSECRVEGPDRLEGPDLREEPD